MKRHTYKHESGDAFWWALMLFSLALLLLGCSSPRHGYASTHTRAHWQNRAHENRGKHVHRMVYREHNREWVCVHCNYNNQNKK